MVLHGLNFKIRSGEKIGIVGRTGAGKSTISVSMSRIVEIFAGHIKIDGVDIQQIPINLLREKITVIPQDPTLFTGTLRMNLDPIGLYSEKRMIELLEEAGLDDLVRRGGLELKLTEGGSNLSSGEK